MATQKRDTESRRGQIVEAALRIVAEKGIDDLSIAMIARHIGLVPSAIYRHFTSKDNILQAIIDRISSTLAANIASVNDTATDPVEKLHLIMHKHLELVRDFPVIPRIIFASDKISPHYLERKAIARGIITGYIGNVREIIIEGQNAGSIDAAIDPDAAATMFIGILMPPVMLWFVTDGAFDTTAYAKKAWPVFLKILRPA